MFLEAFLFLKVLTIILQKSPWKKLKNLWNSKMMVIFSHVSNCGQIYIQWIVFLSRSF